MGERIQNVVQQDYNGRHYRSTLEAETAKVLDSLGIPFEYESRKIILQEGFRCPYQKDKVRDLTYTPDFIIGPIMLECKGFETPEWKIKKKLLFKWFMENEPETIFYQIHDARKALLGALDNHWDYLGYCIEITPKTHKNVPSKTYRFSSVKEALFHIHRQGSSMGSILRSLTGKTTYVFGYKWELVKLKL